MQIRGIPVGDGSPLLLISGLNVLESLEGALTCAEAVQIIAERHGLPVVFKASFDKANRSSQDSYRGPGIDEGMRMLQRVVAETGLPVTTDVHEPGQAKIVAEVADLLPIPSFLSRQTDLVAACAGTDKPLNIKKGQFMAPGEVEQAITERGTSFGFNDLVVDMRGLSLMRRYSPVCLDATHAVQHPGAGDQSSGGDHRFVAPLARAGVAAGIDALFVETHPNPVDAPCDGPCQILLAELDLLLADACAIRAALADARSVG
jgi:2-dehydro-3-deoxyphosphooctonate aldolase (KDO 8-P synthase)